MGGLSIKEYKVDVNLRKQLLKRGGDYSFYERIYLIKYNNGLVVFSKSKALDSIRLNKKIDSLKLSMNDSFIFEWGLPVKEDGWTREETELIFELKFALIEEEIKESLKGRMEGLVIHMKGNNLSMGLIDYINSYTFHIENKELVDIFNDLNKENAERLSHLLFRCLAELIKTANHSGISVYVGIIEDIKGDKLHTFIGLGRFWVIDEIHNYSRLSRDEFKNKRDISIEIKNPARGHKAILKCWRRENKISEITVINNEIHISYEITD